MRELIDFCLTNGADGVRARVAGVPRPQLNGCLHHPGIPTGVKRVLAEAGADVDWREPDDGYTPLHMACHDDRLDDVKFLVEASAAVDSRDFHEDTPLAIAVARGREEITTYLCRMGADRTLANKSGYTPVDIAKDYRQWDCLVLLMTVERDPPHPDVKACEDAKACREDTKACREDAKA